MQAAEDLRLTPSDQRDRHLVLLEDVNQENNRRTCSSHVFIKIYIYKSFENIKETDSCWNIDINGRIILNCILEKYEVTMRTGFRFHKMKSTGWALLIC
jgi:hypothetical protein